MATHAWLLEGWTVKLRWRPISLSTIARSDQEFDPDATCRWDSFLLTRQKVNRLQSNDR
jgi:hypothetical protein